MKLRKKLIGFAGVDSGQIMITDPCYAHDFKPNSYDDDPLTRKGKMAYSYAGACKATGNKDRGGQLCNETGAKMGVAVHSGFGDGVYPVYAYYDDSVNGEGRVKKIVVLFFN